MSIITHGFSPVREDIVTHGFGGGIAPLTILEALEASVEFGYTNNTLFNKALIDRGLTSSSYYEKGFRDEIDLCLIDIYTCLFMHPKVKQGEQVIGFDITAITKAIHRLSNKHTLETSTAIGLGQGADISGESLW